jgi:enoyl-CoA hydratase/carnithine racemase
VNRFSLRRDGDLSWLGLSPPAGLRALDHATIEELEARLAEASLEPGILVVHSTTPGVFAAASEIVEPLEPTDVAALRTYARALERLEAHRWPTIALIDGPALGSGCELALACDFRLASPAAEFGQPVLSPGVIAGVGGYGRLSRLVGLGLAQRVLLTGARLNAHEALSAGLVDDITNDLDRGARALADSITQRSWRSLELAKIALRRPAGTTFDIVLKALLLDGGREPDDT